MSGAIGALRRELEPFGISWTVEDDVARRVHIIEASMGGRTLSYTVSDHEIADVPSPEDLFSGIGRMLRWGLVGNADPTEEATRFPDLQAAARARVMGEWVGSGTLRVAGAESEIPMVVELMNDLEKGGDPDAAVDQIINQRPDESSMGEYGRSISVVPGASWGFTTTSMMVTSTVTSSFPMTSASWRVR